MRTNEQTKSIRRKLAARELVVFIIFTAVFVAFIMLVGKPLYLQAAYKYADIVTPWDYVMEDEFADELASHGVDYYSSSEYFLDEDSTQPDDSLYMNWSETYSSSSPWSIESDDESLTVDIQAEHNEGNFDTTSPSAETEPESESEALESEALSFEGGDNGMSVIDNVAFWTNGTLWAYRDLTPYYNFLSARPAVFIIAFAICALVVMLLGLMRSTRYINELTEAVASLYRKDEKPLKLSNDLAIVRAEITDLRARADADERAAQYAEQRKNDLVAYLAHDIRTPLTSVIGYLDLLKEAPDLPTEQRARYINITYDKALRLEELVSEFFDITRYNLHSIPIEREQVSLQLFCEQVADAFYPVADAKGVGITIRASANTTAFLDPGKMARAIGNVMRNAVTFAAAGTEVVLSAQAQEQSVTIAVTDTGKEISQAHLSSIFEKFFREDSARGSAGGAGLGLAIAREIVEAHGGTISAASENGVTTFTIELPR